MLGVCRVHHGHKVLSRPFLGDCKWSGCVLLCFEAFYLCWEVMNEVRTQRAHIKTAATSHIIPSGRRILSASPWLSRTEPCFPFLSWAPVLATVWKLITGEKGLQPNLFWDLNIIIIINLIIITIIIITWPWARTLCCYRGPWWCRCTQGPRHRCQ